MRQLVEYKKFKDAALHLEGLALRREDVFAREGEAVQLGAEPEVALQDVSIFDLIAAFNEALKKAPKEDLAEIFSDRYTVADKIDYLRTQLRERSTMRLSELIRSMTHRYEMVCTFLAVLELIRLKHLRVRQSAVFGEIEILAVEA